MTTDEYNELFNNSLNNLSQEISVLVEKRAKEAMEKGLSADDAYDIGVEALDNASDTWNDEGQATLED